MNQYFFKDLLQWVYPPIIAKEQAFFFFFFFSFLLNYSCTKRPKLIHVKQIPLSIIISFCTFQKKIIKF